MEVKSVYLDLQKAELNKRGKKSVWKLESEAFKEPLELKIGYDDEDLKLAYREIANLKATVESCDRRVTHLWYDWTRVEEMREEFQNKINNKQNQLNEFREKAKKQDEEINQLYKVIASLKTMVETQSGTILSLQDSMKLMKQKLAKQPTVIHDKAFISWRESTGLWVIELRDGDYLMIAKYKVWEHNEYVVNEDELLFDKIHVEGQHYIPFYKLEWGTELDTPTAEIHYDLIFIPI